VKTPVVLVTGFLGSGKTTLISRLLEHPDMGETAVIVNELGEVGIDHHLLRRVDERTVLLSSGCVCCVLRGDLADELRDLLDRRDSGEVPHFGRVVVETTGVADPTPIVMTLLSDPVVRNHYELESVVATVDACHGLRSPESVKQVAVADRLVITKADVAAPARRAELEEQLARLNPTADARAVAFGEVEPDWLFDVPARDPRDLEADPALELGQREHDHGVLSCVLFLDELDWTAFGLWLTMLLQARGQDILRVKGFLNVGEDGPVLVNCVQHAVHPPVHLDEWPDEDRRSRLVFIGRGLDAERLRASLAAFDRAARQGLA
jgi:G3E family GTPase